MNKKIFITNGMARCGKDTFAELLRKFTPVIKISSIDEIKNIARRYGWNGGKSEKDRKFLSDLKILTSEYNDFPFQSIKNKIEQFNDNTYFNVMLIDIREPEEIEKAKQTFGAKTILITNDRVEHITSNMADANVFNYTYDYTIQNNGTLEDYEKTVKNFYETVIKECD